MHKHRQYLHYWTFTHKQAFFIIDWISVYKRLDKTLMLIFTDTGHLADKFQITPLEVFWHLAGIFVVGSRKGWRDRTLKEKVNNHFWLCRCSPTVGWFLQGLDSRYYARIDMFTTVGWKRELYPCVQGLELQSSNFRYFCLRQVVGMCPLEDDNFCRISCQLRVVLSPSPDCCLSCWKRGEFFA